MKEERVLLKNGRKTNDQFIEDLFLKNKYFRNGEFYIYNEYITATSPLLLITEFGLCKSNGNVLLNGTNPCTVSSAIDKLDFITQELEKVNKNFTSGHFKLVGEYNGARYPMRVETKYGICSLTYASLRSGGKPCLLSAVNKTDYWINYARDMNTNFDNYTFGKTKFVKSNTKVIITCKDHGEFKIKPNNFTSKNQGCIKCLDRKEIAKDNGAWCITKWIEKAEKSKNFDSFKVYIIRCWNETEEFYKIGRTFSTVKKRFSNKTLLPYRFEVLKEISNGDAHHIGRLETELKSKNRDNRYKPEISFNGMWECFSKIEIDEY